MNDSVQQEAVVSIAKTSIEDGDVLFVDCEAIDTSALRNVLRDAFPDKVWAIVPVFVQPGNKVVDYITVAKQA